MIASAMPDPTIEQDVVGPLRFVGEPAPISADALLAVELAAGATIPPTLREAVGRWGWGKLADVFFLSFTKERPHDLGSLAKTMPGAHDATWVLLGGDESREHALYCVALGGSHRARSRRGDHPWQRSRRLARARRHVPRQLRGAFRSTRGAANAGAHLLRVHARPGVRVVGKGGCATANCAPTVLDPVRVVGIGTQRG